MHCVKLLGQSLMARDFDGQVAEIQIRAAILNGFATVGIPETVAVGSSIRPGSGEVRPQPELCNKSPTRNSKPSLRANPDRYMNDAETRQSVSTIPAIMLNH